MTRLTRRLQKAFPEIFSPELIEQVGLAMVLLAAAAVLVESFQEMRRVEPGFTAEGVLAMELSLPQDRTDESRRTVAFWLQTLERMEGLPGVRSAAIGPVPLEMGRGARRCSSRVGR